MSKRVYGNKKNEWGEPLDSWVQNQLQYDHSELDYYNNHSKNGIEDRAERTEQAFGRLVEKLMDKGLLSQSDILDIVNVAQCASRKVEIRESNE